MTFDVIVMAKQSGVEIITLPPHTSHELELFNVACFRSSNNILEPIETFGLCLIL